MKKTKIWFITAGLIILLGITLFIIACGIADWKFTNFDTNKYQTETHEVTQEFNNIAINTKKFGYRVYSYH